jgi:hypothetical protein
MEDVGRSGGTRTPNPRFWSSVGGVLSCITWSLLVLFCQTFPARACRSISARFGSYY